MVQFDRSCLDLFKSLIIVNVFISESIGFGLLDHIDTLLACMKSDVNKLKAEMLELVLWIQFFIDVTVILIEFSSPSLYRSFLYFES